MATIGTRVKHNVLTVVVLLAIVLLTDSSVSAQTSAPQRYTDKGKIVYCADLSYPPWTLIDPNSMQPAGVDIEISTAIAKAMGLKSEYKNIQFAGLIPAIQAGQCDAIVSTLIDKPERREVLDFVDYANVGNAVIVLAKSDISVSDLTGLFGKKVVVQSGSQIEQDLVAANEKIKAAGKAEMKIVSLPDNTSAMQQLLSGIADAYYGSPEQAAYFNSQNPGSVKLASPILTARPVGIATVKKDGDLHDAMKRAFKAVRASGEYHKIMSDAGLESLELPDQ